MDVVGLGLRGARVERVDVLVRPYGLTADGAATSSVVLERLILTYAWEQAVAEEEVSAAVKTIAEWAERTAGDAEAGRWGLVTACPRTKFEAQLARIRVLQEVTRRLGSALSVQRRKEEASR